MEDDQRSSTILRPRPGRPDHNIYTSPAPSTPVESSETNLEQPTEGTATAGSRLHRADAIPPTSRTLHALSSSTTNSTSSTPQKTRSILNLTTSTLFGIYSPTESEDSRDEPSSPWDTGSQTPARSISVRSFKTGNQLHSSAGKRVPEQGTAGGHRPRSMSGSKSAPVLRMALLLRTVVLLAIGMTYGVIMRQLHDKSHLAPVRVQAIDRESWRYLGFWGVAGVVLGYALPWVDRSFRTKASEKHTRALENERPSEDGGNFRTSLGTEWNPIVRSIGAFVGIAFAIRKLPWQSTLQVSLTLALVNPVIWYLIDRSKAGFGLSTVVGITGAALLLGVNPDMVPPPSTPTNRLPLVRPSNTSTFALAQGPELDVVGGLISYESIGVATWISSVLFCSCVCFGNIGRRLAAKG